MLSIENVSYTYKGKHSRPVLKDISLGAEKGFTFLVGENGSGKTTLIKLITGILAPSSGRISFDGLPVGSMEYRKRIAYLPQVFDVYPQLRVREVLSFVAGLNGVKANVEQAAARAGASEFLDKKMKCCSEGMRRRAGIASTLIGDPDIVIMDEPTAGVDPGERIAFYRTVKECFEGKTVLISTHVLGDADYLADNIAMLSRGSLAYAGDYSAYRRSLDGKVGCVICSANELGSVERKYIVLSVQKTDTGYRCHVLCNGENSPVLSPVEPTLEDVWLYYERQV